MTYAIFVEVGAVNEENYASGIIWRNMHFFPSPDMPLPNPLRGDAVIVELELDVQPKLFAELEKAGLKVGPGADVEVSVSTITELGITLHVACEKIGDIRTNHGQMFIPMSRIISINELTELGELAKRYKATVDGKITDAN